MPDLGTGNGARRRAADSPHDEAETFAIVTEIIGAVGGFEQSELTPERRVGDLSIDSILAGEIIAQAERALDVDIDIRKISDDWSELTLRELVAQFMSGFAGAR